MICAGSAFETLAAQPGIFAVDNPCHGYHDGVVGFRAEVYVEVEDAVAVAVNVHANAAH